MPADAQALVQAVRSSAIDPFDQVRALTILASYNPVLTPNPAPIGGAILETQTATAAVCRRAALAALARACAAYNPTSYNEAITLRQNAAALFDAEILIAADSSNVATYNALRAMRTAVVIDLNTRAATLAGTD